MRITLFTAGILSLALVMGACSKGIEAAKQPPANGGSPGSANGGPDGTSGKNSLPPGLPNVAPSIKIDGVGSSSSTDPLRCLRPFIAIQDGKIQELEVQLSKNLDCLEKGAIEERNYFTFALETGNLEVIRTLLQIPNDKEKFRRIYQKDARKKSIFTIAMENPKTYGLLASSLYDWGMRAEQDREGNLADLLWAAQDGRRTYELASKDLVFAAGKGTTLEPYLVSGARDFFADLIRAAAAAGMPLDKTFSYGGGQSTLLQIACRSAWDKNFDSSLLRLYLENGFFASEGQLNESVLANLWQVRSQLKEREVIAKLDVFFFEIAKKHPLEWARYAEGANKSEANALIDVFNSVLSKNTVSLAMAVEALIPVADPMRIWVLPAKLRQSPRATELLQLLAGRGRLPAEKDVTSLSSARPYIEGLKRGLYQQPAKCTLLSGIQNTSGLSESDARELITLGLSGPECDFVALRLVRSSPESYGTALEIVKAAGLFPGELATLGLKAMGLENLWKFISDRKAMDLFLQTMSGQQLTSSFWNEVFFGSDARLKTLKSRVEFLAQNSVSLEAAKRFAKSKIPEICGSENLAGADFAEFKATFKSLDLVFDASCMQKVWARQRNERLWDTLDRFFGNDPKGAAVFIRDFNLGREFCQTLEMSKVGDVIQKYGVDSLECWQSVTDRFAAMPLKDAPVKPSQDVVKSTFWLALGTAPIRAKVIKDALERGCYIPRTKEDKGKVLPSLLAMIALQSKEAGAQCAEQWIFHTDSGIGAFAAMYQFEPPSWHISPLDFERYYLEPWGDIELGEAVTKPFAHVISDLAIVGTWYQFWDYWQNLKADQAPAFIGRALNIVEEDLCLGLPEEPGSRRLQNYDRSQRACRVEPLGFAYESQAQNRLMAFPMDSVLPRSLYKVYGNMALSEFRSRTYSGPYGDALKSKVNSYLYFWMARMIMRDAEDCARGGSRSRAVCDDLATLTKAELIPVFCAHQNYYMWGGLPSSPMTVFQKLIGLKLSSSECPASVQ